MDTTALFKKIKKVKDVMPKHDVLSIEHLQ